jgi:hypothetical protein
MLIEPLQYKEIIHEKISQRSRDTFKLTTHIQINLIDIYNGDIDSNSYQRSFKYRTFKPRDLWSWMW